MDQISIRSYHTLSGTFVNWGHMVCLLHRGCLLVAQLSLGSIPDITCMTSRIGTPGLPVFQCSTLKNWEWPGDEARE